ncbi:hypothetical protein GUJ93_ZPchr0002g24476 [Zizania palustris]|uniref:Uncharacterized protein n=1 Tax=Zizania palustris TaxID=103762 RepID=A0A8J5RGU2_ZIZPA|nr:hypothetical protein GUJ93_ZPchr0002g24476 [Zizania palustris]
MVISSGAWWEGADGSGGRAGGGASAGLAGCQREAEVKKSLVPAALGPTQLLPIAGRPYPTRTTAVAAEGSPRCHQRNQRMSRPRMRSGWRDGWRRRGAGGVWWQGRRRLRGHRRSLLGDGCEACYGAWRVEG